MKKLESRIKDLKSKKIAGFPILEEYLQENEPNKQLIKDRKTLHGTCQ